jgi:hypothetical protein
MKVLINTKNENNETISEYGYILRRLNAHAYEIWVESLQLLFILHPDEFEEIEVHS